ncbi:tripartite tricarboxylate transporter permease [Alkalihalobacillus sp. BA299]|uniref:tripartite tricarboxylate transporter permease n=1 Tax=Alkalihalobacillus sp. BA299 TaxID=2815938 RepID=UPI001ADC5193|nr:tripartite tricarboxylate transporter permease [Alkalihalobacillus sp. BA299]
MEQVIAQIFDFQTLFLVFIGVFLGILFSAIPGLTATMGIALLIPYTFALPQVAGISMLLGIYLGGMYGGAITAILIRTPGTPSAAATLLDGYPMAEKGEAGRALSFATIGSFIGGIISCIILMLIAPQLAQAGLRFGPAEFFALAVFGLSIVGTVSGKNVIKGIIVAAIGLLIATIGMDPINGAMRFTFGSANLTSGIAFIPALIGLFAVSQVIKEIEGKVKSNHQKKVKYQRQRVSIKEVAKNWVEFLRAGIIGTFIGIIPGTGTSIATFLSYNESKRFAKPERRKEYGKGIPEGVIATETSNNAVTGGALVPLLTLGIPGDVVTAVILGGLLIQGVTPGPLLFQNEQTLVYSLFGTLIIANIFMLLIGLFAIRFVGKIVDVPKTILLPIIVTLCFIGSYSLSNNLFDVWVALAFGVIGYLLEKFDYPLAPLILGIILGPIIESNLRRALIESGNSISIFATKPIAAVFLSIAIISLIYPIVKLCIEKFKKNSSNEPNSKAS